MTFLEQVYDVLTTPVPQAVTRKTAIWWGLSVAIALLFAILALHDAFSTEQLVQDDARQYLFWMQRFQNPDLFPNDLIADYFQSVTPLGYIAFYRVGIALGIDPFTFNKLLPIALAIITTGYFFWFAMALIPLPATAFLASLLLNQTVWMKDDLVSATPRAFLYPLFTAFLYYLTQSTVPHSHRKSGHWQINLLKTGIFSTDASPLPVAIALILLGVFYPQYVLVAGGVIFLSLVTWHSGKLRLSVHHFDWICAGLYLAVAVVIIGFYGLTASDYDPVVTVEQARAMPEFWPGGRNFFFSENLWWFYGVGNRSGFLHVGLVRPATLALGIFLPLLLWQMPHHPVLRCCIPYLRILPRLLIAATGLFLLAHLLLFQLHLPSRYTDHSLRFVMAIAAAIVITAVLEILLRPKSQPVPSNPPSPSPGKWRRGLATGTALLLTGLVVIYPVFVEDFPLTKYKQGTAPRLYEFFREQPTDTLIASVAEEVNNIPVFAQRSILVGREYAIPYHLGFYNTFHDRAIALIHAQYSDDPQVAIAFIKEYDVDYWIIDNEAYEPDYIINAWTVQYWDDVAEVVTLASQGAAPALIRGIAHCTVAQQHSLTVLNTSCLVDALQP